MFPRFILFGYGSLFSLLFRTRVTLHALCRPIDRSMARPMDICPLLPRRHQGILGSARCTPQSPILLLNACIWSATQYYRSTQQNCYAMRSTFIICFDAHSTCRAPELFSVLRDASLEIHSCPVPFCRVPGVVEDKDLCKG